MNEVVTPGITVLPCTERVFGKDEEGSDTRWVLTAESLSQLRKKVRKPVELTGNGKVSHDEGEGGDDEQDLFEIEASGVLVDVEKDHIIINVIAGLKIFNGNRDHAIQLRGRGDFYFHRDVYRYGYWGDESRIDSLTVGGQTFQLTKPKTA